MSEKRTKYYILTQVYVPGELVKTGLVFETDSMHPEEFLEFLQAAAEKLSPQKPGFQRGSYSILDYKEQGIIYHPINVGPARFAEKPAKNL